MGGQDPTTDLAADQALFPAVVSAATLLNTDSSLVSQLKTAEGEIEPYARTDEATHQQLLNPQPTSASATATVDAAGTDVIADSYQPSATIRNSENIGLEPVWPWGVIGDSTTVNGDNLTALADRTYNYRPNVNIADWSFDAVDAARLDMSSQVESDLVAITEKYQAYISGLVQLQRRHPGRRAVHRAVLHRGHRHGRGPRHRLRRHPAHRPGLAVRLGRARAPSTSRAAPRSTCRSRAAPSPRPPSRPAPPRP